MRNPALQRLQIPIEAYRKTVQENLAPHRFELLEQQVDWILRTESWIHEYFIPGRDVDIARIQPKLELVRTERQHAIWRYCRLKGSIPYNRGCGRLLRYLLRDEGQPNAPIMGVISLSSPVLINKPRDHWIGWRYPEHTDLKRHKLLSCMDLTVSMAIPPYNYLTAGKMICLAMLSEDVRKDYWAQPDLAMLMLRRLNFLKWSNILKILVNLFLRDGELGALIVSACIVPIADINLAKNKHQHMSNHDLFTLRRWLKIRRRFCAGKMKNLTFIIFLSIF